MIINRVNVFRIFDFCRIRDIRDTSMLSVAMGRVHKSWSAELSSKRKEKEKRNKGWIKEKNDDKKNKFEFFCINSVPDLDKKIENSK